MNKLEKTLLAKLAAKLFDGQVGDDFTTNGGSTVWTEIKNGVPVRYKLGPTKRFFDGKENERIPGVLHIQEQFRTDKEKLDFFKRFGWLIQDKDAQTYSAKYKK